jgi:hypothetical protein
VLSENVVTIAENDKVYGYAVSENKFVLRTGRKIICVGK